MNKSSIIELLREEAIKALFQSPTVKANWEIWKDEIKKCIGESPTPDSILNIGSNLRDIFKKTGVSGRSQNNLSSGGIGWESLVCWYINLCCAGTRVVAIRKKKLLPKPVLDAITVNYGNSSCSSESDITVLVFPDIEEYTKDDKLRLRSGAIDTKRLDQSVTNNFTSFELGIIQCKTNWNDNAQIPMLWDIVYTSGGIATKQVSVGKNNFEINNIKKFTYSFVTAPTNDVELFKENSTCVGRVKHLSGGNYWGLGSKESVAKSIKEIFINYKSGFPGGIRQSINQIIPCLSSKDLSYFKI